MSTINTQTKKSNSPCERFAARNREINRLEAQRKARLNAAERAKTAEKKKDDNPVKVQWGNESSPFSFGMSRGMEKFTPFALPLVMMMTMLSNLMQGQQMQPQQQVQPYQVFPQAVPVMSSPAAYSYPVAGMPLMNTMVQPQAVSVPIPMTYPMGYPVVQQPVSPVASVITPFMEFFKMMLEGINQKANTPFMNYMNTLPVGRVTEEKLGAAAAMNLADSPVVHQTEFHHTMADNLLTEIKTLEDLNNDDRKRTGYQVEDYEGKRKKAEADAKKAEEDAKKPKSEPTYNVPSFHDITRVMFKKV